MSKLTYLLLLFFLSIVPSLLGGSSFYIEQKVYISVIGFLIMLACSGIYHSMVGKMITFVVTSLWTLNLSISLFFYREHDIVFSSSIAETFINTNSSETIGMLSYNKYYVLFYAFVFAIYYFLIYKMSSFSNIKTAKRSLIIIILLMITTPIYKNLAIRPENNNKLLVEYTFLYTPFYNAAALVKTFHENRQIKKIASHHVNLHYDKVDDKPEFYILIIGESVRRDHLGIYGYPYDTTPNLKKEKENILLFNQVYSPAPVTILSVPISLSNIGLDQLQDKTHYADNIVSLANHAGFKTYWLSNQGEGNQKTSVISVIANMAQNKQWNRFIGYDEELLPYLDKALSDKSSKKKLIILHTYGSHEPACNRFPSDELKSFTSQPDDNCYDSSIHYTDKFIGQIIDKVKDKPASVLYFADHALQRLDKNREIHYHHGVHTPRQEAYNIPLFIWYSSLIDKPTINNDILSQPYSTANNYWLLSDWLGIKHHSKKVCHSPLNECYKGAPSIMVIDGNKYLFDYSKLKSEEQEPQ
ncbi:phosphoethanolamine transferase [Proteus vulgaris]|uniref:phosphoethanolamine transferase n=1 Tax=Proteus vulgaris TaxID=585 RepID=UPI0018E46DBC|nr:phosphoethanolamine transferase [Proteus vulgaris]MBI6530073.1 phosphoethanolamine transferase [Proteus vulgaris]